MPCWRHEGKSSAATRFWQESDVPGTGMFPPPRGKDDPLHASSPPGFRKIMAMHPDFVARPNGRQQRFERQLQRLDLVAKMSLTSLADRHRAALRSDTQQMRTLVDDADNLRERLGKVHSQLQPQLEQLDPRRGIDRWSKVDLVAAPTQAQLRATVALQKAFRQRRCSSLAEHLHCPVLLRRNFVRGIPTRLAGAVVNDAGLPLSARSAGGGDESREGKHFMSIL